MAIPLFYKSLGVFKSATLDNPLMRNYQIILDRMEGDSLDLFAFRSTRCTVNNQFDPEMDWPTPRESEDDSLYHMPVMGRKDRRNVLQVLKGRRFDCILIDPPFTPMQQKELYSESTHSDLLNDSHEAIEELYRVSCDFAFQHARRVVVVYGYKMVPPSNGFKARAVWAIGGGSHPAIMAVMYARDEEEALVQALKSDAEHQKAEISNISQREYDRSDFETYVGKEPKSDRVYLLGSSTELKRSGVRMTHPAYLSEGMYRLSKMKSISLCTRMLAFYKCTKNSDGTKRTCFDKPPSRRYWMKSRDYGDVLFVLDK